MDGLRKYGALYKDDIKMPATIRDAMFLLKSLGERFLWVDSLSVLQDQDKHEMNATLKAMARIYASAEFTIVASYGTNADYGLRGVGGTALPRQPNEPSFHGWLSPAYPYDSIWATRGWSVHKIN